MLKIGELAKRAGISADTLRLYERRGLLQSERLANGYRVYDPDMERVVNLIRQGQRLGFTLREMSQIVGAMAQGKVDSTHTAALMQEKIVEVDAKLEELKALRRVLTTLHAQSCPLRAKTH